MTLLRPGTRIMSMTPATIVGPADAQGLVSSLIPCWYPRVMVPPGPCWYPHWASVKVHVWLCSFAEARVCELMLAQEVIVTMLCWPCPSMDTASGELDEYSGESSPKSAFRTDVPTPHHRHVSSLDSILELTLWLESLVSQNTLEMLEISLTE